MSFPPPRRFGVPAIIITGLAVALMAVLATRRATVIVPGQPIHFDDVFFTVRAAERMMPGRETSAAQRRPSVVYRVSLTVDNKAKRVPYRFEARFLVLFDPLDPSKLYHASLDQEHVQAQSVDVFKNPLVLKAGESATQDYTFLVPETLVAPRLKVMTGGRIGETLDRLLGDYREVQLP